MLNRLKRLGETFIAKKYVAWMTACVFLWFGKITGTDWVLLTGIIFGLDLATKMNVPAGAK
jgi:hypothetical protein